MKEPKRLVKAPEPFASTIDHQMALDRAYFKAHPSATDLVRRVTPGEFWPYEPLPGVLVLVRQLGPGLRTRELVVVGEGAA